MQRKRGSLVPVAEVVGGLDGPVKALAKSSPQALHHFTRFDQMNQLVRGHCHVNRVGPQRPAWIPFQAAALALSHTLNASFRNRLNVSLLHK